MTGGVQDGQTTSVNEVQPENVDLQLTLAGNTTYFKSLLNFNNSFEYDIVNQNNMKNYIRNKTKNSDILITSRIDYDDRIYYDAINDLRKAINMEKPIIIHGYNKGLYFFEKDNKYYDYYRKVSVSSVLASLILNLKKVNDTYTTLLLIIKFTIDKIRMFLR